MHPLLQSPRRTLLISHTTAIKNNILEDERYTVKNVSICVMYTYKINNFPADHTGYSESSEYPGKNNKATFL